MFDIGNEREALDFMLDTWLSTDGADFFKQWPFGIAEGLIFKKGAVDTTPELEYITKLVTPLKSIKRRFVVGISDANNGKFKLTDGRTILHSKRDDEV